MGRKNYKGNRIGEQFLAIPHSVLKSPRYIALPPHAVKLLYDVAVQYRGNNNGDLCTAWKLMKQRGWRSEATLHKAKRQLLEAGFLYETRKGHRPNLCSLFALTWLNFDDNKEKFDIGARAGFVRNEFRFKEPLVALAAPAKNAAPTSSRVAAGPAQRHAA